MYASIKPISSVVYTQHTNVEKSPGKNESARSAGQLVGSFQPFRTIPRWSPTILAAWFVFPSSVKVVAVSRSASNGWEI